MKHAIKGLMMIEDGNSALTLTGKPAKIFLCDYLVMRAWWELGVKGTITFEVSLNDESGKIRWYELENYAQVIDGLSSGEIEINMERMAHALIRPIFTPNGGTGLLNIEMNGKSIGG